VVIVDGQHFFEVQNNHGNPGYVPKEYSWTLVPYIEPAKPQFQIRYNQNSKYLIGSTASFRIVSLRFFLLLARAPLLVCLLPSCEVH